VSSRDDESEIDLVAVWQVMWDHKYLIALITAACTTLALVLALTATEIFRAEVVLTEVHESGMGNGSGIAGQLGGLAGLVGINLGAAGGVGQEARAVLASRRLIEEFVRRYELLPELLKKSKQKPIMWFAVNQFREGVLSIKEDEAEGTITVAVDWTDAVTAARWANDFVALANEIVRTRAIDESKRNITYLNEQISNTHVVEIQRVMYNLIETETKTLMLANGRAEYAFSVVDPAVPPEIRVRPRRTVMVLLGVVLGFFLGTMAAFGHQTFVRSKAKAARA
jgi:uncharacterized protein involved in exopolysaccharide biosynthesis